MRLARGRATFPRASCLGMPVVSWRCPTGIHRLAEKNASALPGPRPRGRGALLPPVQYFSQRISGLAWRLLAGCARALTLRRSLGTSRGVEPPLDELTLGLLRVPLGLPTPRTAGKTFARAPPWPLRLELGSPGGEEPCLGLGRVVSCPRFIRSRLPLGGWGFPRRPEAGFTPTPDGALATPDGALESGQLGFTPTHPRRAGIAPSSTPTARAVGEGSSNTPGARARRPPGP
jgi:hypothetical protein